MAIPNINLIIIQSNDLAIGRLTSSFNYHAYIKSFISMQNFPCGEGGGPSGGGQNSGELWLMQKKKRLRLLGCHNLIMQSPLSPYSNSFTWLICVQLVVSHSTLTSYTNTESARMLHTYHPESHGCEMRWWRECLFLLVPWVKNMHKLLVDEVILPDVS